MALLKRVDWQEKELPYSAAEVARYEARVRRLRAEVAEIRAAAEGMRAAGGPFLLEVTAFLDREAWSLESSNEADGGVELRWEDDTRDMEGYSPTSGRRALLIARAWTAERSSG